MVAAGVVVAVADVCGCGETAVSCFRYCVAAAALVLWCGWRIAVPGLCCGAGGCVAVRCCLWCRRLCVVTVLCRASGAVLRQRQMCVVPVLCRASGAVLRQRLAYCGAWTVCGSGRCVQYRYCVEVRCCVWCRCCVRQRRCVAVPALCCGIGGCVAAPAGVVVAAAGVLRCRDCVAVRCCLWCRR